MQQIDVFVSSYNDLHKPGIGLVVVLYISIRLCPFAALCRYLTKLKRRFSHEARDFPVSKRTEEEDGTPYSFFEEESVLST